MADESDDFRLVDVLQARLANMEHRPKRARTRAALIAATAQQMEVAGIDGLTVARIADAAGTAHGTFYLYFENRLDAAMAVRRLYQAAVRLFRPRGGGELPAFEAIIRMNRFYVRSFANNADLLRAIQLLLYTRPDFPRQRDNINHRWSQTVLYDFQRRATPRQRRMSRPAMTMMARSAIAMADELLREIYLHNSASLNAMRQDEKQLVELLSLAWFRVIYGADPPPKATSAGG
jgi:AcrR family transcriptional regulator